MIPSPIRNVYRSLTSRKKRPWLLVAIGFILVIAAWKTKLGAPQPEPDTIAYHYGQWLHHKENLVWGIETNRFSIKKAIWYLDGKPPHRTRLEKFQRHEDILVRLGFFECRDFDLKGRSMGESVQFIGTFNNLARRANLVSHINAVQLNQQGMALHLTARKEDMPAIESIIKQIERATTNHW